MAGKRLYLGRLPPDARSDDVKKHFEGYGNITECRVMTGFGFVEFESSRDAEDVVNNFHNKPFMGSSIVVEFAKESRRREDRGDFGRGGPPPRRTEQRRPAGIRVNVSGISRDTSWQDLKDFGREAGNVSFADVERDMPGRGVLEYLTAEDADHAVRSLDGKDLRGVAVRLSLDEHGGSRRSPPRRERSRSPGASYRRRDDNRERRRSRSPPPRRYEERREEREYRRDDRREDRRDDQQRGYERERPDRRFDDRMREDERERGDGGWDNRR
ncbi:hypothetical protein FRC01_005231 [Tulasnella sp. 417]|nr:hypothetical protein FRC01_005231 [Tulasnella sp. 417]